MKKKGFSLGETRRLLDLLIATHSHQVWILALLLLVGCASAEQQIDIADSRCAVNAVAAYDSGRYRCAFALAPDVDDVVLRHELRGKTLLRLGDAQSAHEEFRAAIDAIDRDPLDVRPSLRRHLITLFVITELPQTNIREVTDAK